MNLVEILISVAIIVLIIFSAFFSSCEVAYSTVSKFKLKNEEEKGNKKAIKTLKVIDHYSETLTTVLVGNNIVNILISSLGTVLAIRKFGEDKGPLISTIFLTILLLIFGEILPKILGKRFNYNLSLFYTPIFNFFKMLFFPITWVVNKIISGLFKHKKEEEQLPTATDEELITIVDELEEEGVIDEDDEELIKSAIDFCDVTAHEIMIPRVDVFAIDIEDSKEDILNNDEIYKYSRVPVYDGSIDNVIGILNTTDLMKLLLSKEEVDLKSMLMKPIFVFKTKSISSILTELKTSHVHLAIVVDEFGGTMGILTIEDIVEELIGDVFDELDEVEEDYKECEDGTYIVDGDMNIYDFFELIDYDDRDFESEYTTVGGWCTDVLEKFPEPGDHFDFANITVEITEADKMRVGKVHVTVHPKDDNEEDE